MPRSVSYAESIAGHTILSRGTSGHRPLSPLHTAPSRITYASCNAWSHDPPGPVVSLFERYRRGQSTCPDYSLASFFLLFESPVGARYRSIFDELAQPAESIVPLL